MAEPPIHTTTTPVLIIGGGIVGLSASLFLSSHSIPHQLIERHPTTSQHPRARGLNTRAMEIFRSIGIDAAVREAGASLSPSNGIVKGSSFVQVMERMTRKEVDVDGDGKRGAMPLAGWLDGVVSPTEGARCTQDKMEPVLAKAASERGGDLRYNTQCEGVEQDEQGVTVTLRDREPPYTVSTIRAQYLIAADGASSPMRKALGIGTTGKGALGNLINILFRADLSALVRGREISLCTIVQPSLRGLLTAINNSDIWVFHLCYDPDEEKAGAYTTERVADLLRLAIGIPDLDIEIKSMIPWQPSDVAAQSMQRGRIFLAGDAAHQTTPYAGQGATTGIADVFDLCWKLACVLSGQASSSLLETYESERLPVARFVTRESGELADEYGLPDMKRGKVTWAWNMARRLPMIVGFGYQYSDSAAVINEEEPLGWMSWWHVPWSVQSLVLGINGKPGTRVPHVWVHDAAGERVSTLDLCGKTLTFLLLTGSQGKAWCQAADDVAEKMGVGLQAYRVGPTGDVSDAKRRWEFAAGIGARGALLVRPDGFVAWRVKDQQGDLGERLGGVLRKILCR
ncbi:Tetracenomycin polyketide synthesis hydroxylase [Lachnellula occidentalis]|uniref:Tetracenomycin polyketide synthesis hydroxylase n=1 Tax=Lachnellula occidentalis TaxID=215460 RepID=A0A8H8RLP9_9HELO|nr:Tetracenomycin polyketide synthesis hydroxylase [Lachnellula occidentalis]